MSTLFHKFLSGLGLVPSGTSNASVEGELEALTSDHKLHYHNGTVTSPLITEANLTAGSITGQIPVSSGGTGAATLTAHGVLLGEGTSAVSAVSPSATSGQALISQGASADPVYGAINLAGGSSIVTGTLPVGDGGTGQSSLTAHDVLVGNGTSAVTLVAPSATSGVALVSNGSSSDPSFGAINLASASAVTGTLPVANGGTGDASFTAYAVLAGGTTSTGPLQQVSGLGSSGQVLTSNGAGALPTWQAATSGSASSGSKNYLSAITTSNGNNTGNGNFELGTTSGWSLAHSALSSFIPTSTASAGTAFDSTHGGSAASGNLSLTTVSSGQLSGLYSGSLASTAASTAGDLLISNAFNIDTEDQAKVMQVKFYYNVHSGSANLNFSGTSSNSFAVWIYDVTNGSWIMPAGVYNLVQNSGTGYCTATFQTTSNSTQYQLALININASSGAYTLYLDDLSVGPQIAPSGPAVNDWALNAYTFTFTGLGTTSGTNVYTKRVGDTLKVRGYVTGGTPTAVALTINLPSNLSIDSTKFTNTSNLQQVGQGFNVQGTNTGTFASSGFGPFVVFYDGSTTNSLFVSHSTTVGTYNKDTGSATIASNTNFTFDFEIPISGWSSNTVMSSDTDTRVVAMAYHNTTAGTSLSSTTNIAYTVKDFDTHSAYNTSTGLYTVPVAGIFRVSGALRANSTSVTPGNVLNIYIYQNGSEIINSETRYESSSNTSQDAQLTHLIQCKAGDTLEIRADSNTNTPVTISNNNIYYIAIERLSGPAVVAATESVNMTYYNISSTTVTSGTALVFTTKAFDSHNAFNTSTGVYTVPVSGKYQVSTNTAVTTSGICTLQLFKNGSAVYGANQNSAVMIINSGSAGGNPLFVSCNAGDTLTVVPAASVTLSGATGNISITRIGN